MGNLILKTKSNQVADGRVVTVAVNAFGNVDSQGDISVNGSFNKTLGENFKRIKHFLNHDYDKLIGCPLEGREEGGYLVMKSELANTQLANDVLEFYKLYDKNGLTLEHSIGVEAMQRDKSDVRKVLQWKMWEFSTLYNWGSNPNTPLLDLKALMTKQMPEKTLSFIKSALSLDFSDGIMLKYDEYRQLIEKAMEGKSGIIDCECGCKFDYYAQREHSLANDVMEYYANELRYITARTAEQVAEEKMPEIEDEVRRIIEEKIKRNEVEEEGGDLKKSLLTDMRYVRCPRCGRMHFSSEIVDINKTSSTTVVKPAVTTSQQTAAAEEGSDGQQDPDSASKSVNLGAIGMLFK